MGARKYVVNSCDDNLSIPILGFSGASTRLSLFPVLAGFLYMTSILLSYSVSIICHNTNTNPMPFISDISTQRPEAGLFALFSSLAAAAATVSIQLLYQLCDVTERYQVSLEDSCHRLRRVSQLKVNNWRRTIGHISCLAMFLLCIFPQDRPSTLTGSIHIGMSFVHAIAQYVYWLLYVVFELRQRQQQPQLKHGQEKTQRCKSLIWLQCTCVVATSVGGVAFLVLRCALADEETVQYLRYLVPTSSPTPSSSASALLIPSSSQLELTRSLYTYTAVCEWVLFGLEVIGLMTMSVDLRRYLAEYTAIFGCSNCPKSVCRSNASTRSDTSSGTASSLCSENGDEDLNSVVVS